MLDVDLALPLGFGLVAAFNPCGFAMLPTYVAYFVGSDQDDAPNAMARMRRGLVVALAVSLGFVLVFGLFGIVITGFRASISDRLPWLTLAIGIGLVPVGIAMLAGWEPKINLPRLQRGGRDGSLPSMFLFGVSYATVSLSCTLPVFLGAVATSFRDTSFASGMAAFLAYAAGMMLVITVLTAAVALAQDRVVQFLRSGMSIVQKASGVLLVVGGAYVAYYGWTEIQIIRGNSAGSGGPIEWFTDRSNDANRFVTDVGSTTLALSLVAVLAGLVGVAMLLSRRRSPES